MASDVKNPTVIIVDDEEMVLTSLSAFLSLETDYEIKTFLVPSEAIAFIKQSGADLVISDYLMPEMDGIELLDAVKKLDKRVVVMVITGYASIESAVKAIKNGAYDFIPKPFTMEELEVIVNRALEQHILFRQLGVFRGLTLALIISVPIWLILGIILGLLWKG